MKWGSVVMSFAFAACAAFSTLAVQGAETDSPTDSLIEAAMANGYWSAGADSSAQAWVQGPRFRLRTIAVCDEGGRPLEGWGGSEWTGEPATRRNLETVQASVLGDFRKKGFPFVTLITLPEADTSGLPFVDLVVKVRRGAGFKLGQPLVQQTRTQPAVLRRLALWVRGESYDPDRIEKGLRRLRRLGYFESTEWSDLYQDSARNVLYPLLRLPDLHASSMGGLLGYDSKAAEGDRLTGFLDVLLQNMRGTARDFAFSFESRPGQMREASIAYTEPWIASLPIGARWEASIRQQDTLFEEWNQDLVVFRDLDFSSRVEARFGAQANRHTLEDGNTSLSRAYRSGVRVTYDTRDRAPFTRLGTQAEASLSGMRRSFDATGSSGSGNGGDSAYFLVQGKATLARWEPLTERLGLWLALRGASNFPLNRLNRGELWEVGGARSLRGYRERAFQTNAYLLGDAELQLAMGRRGRLIGFASPGLVNRPVGKADPQKVLGYGAGMELAQADWSVTLTYALNPDRSPGNGFLHVALENRF